MKNVLFALAGLILIHLCACQKKTPSYHEAIDSFLVQNFNYKVGTYWVYKDSITGEEDSFVVNDNTFSSIPTSNSNNTFGDAIQMNIIQFNATRTKVATWQMSLVKSFIGLVYYGNIEIDYSTFVETPFQIGQLGYNDKDSGYVVSVNNIDTINYNVYNSVAKIKHVNFSDPIFPHFDNTFYFNKDFGIIKMNLSQDVHNIWELKQYKIIK